jgi:phosphatidylglycerophosphate synthase
MFLSSHDKESLKNWKYKVADHGILSNMFNPIYSFLAELMPPTISPNIISFVGLLFSIYALNHSYTNTFTHNCVTSYCILVYMTLDAIDGKHARNTRSSSPLGELIDHFCDCITNVLLTIIFCNVYDIDNNQLRWYYVMMTQVVFLKEHVDAFTRESKIVIFGKYNGPTEALCLLCTAIFCRQLFGPIVAAFIGNVIMSMFLCALFTYSIVMIMYRLWTYSIKIYNFETITGVAFCTIIQVAKCIDNKEYGNEFTTISNGFILSTLCADIILAKMADRELHPLVPVMHFITLVIPYTEIVFTIVYFVINTIQISKYLNVPIVAAKNFV